MNVNLVLQLFILILHRNPAKNVTVHVMNAMDQRQLVLHVQPNSSFKIHPILVWLVINRVRIAVDHLQMTVNLVLQLLTLTQ
jgi:hypothetical protein